MKSSFGMLIRETPEELTDPSATALLVVDVQNDFTHPDGAVAERGVDMSALTALPDKVARVVDLARGAGVMVVWIQNTVLENALGESPAWHASRIRKGWSSQYTMDGSWGQQFSAPLEPQPGEPIVQKLRSSSFIRTPLEGILKGKGIECLVVVGCMTDACVESTVRNALHLDFYPTIVPDALAASSQQHHDDAITRMSDGYNACSTAELAELWPPR